MIHSKIPLNNRVYFLKPSKIYEFVSVRIMYWESLLLDIFENRLSAGGGGEGGVSDRPKKP